MDFSFLKEKWNLLLEFAMAIMIVVSGFVEIPEPAAVALSSAADYEKYGRFIVAIILGLVLILCRIWNRRKNVWWWASATLFFLLAGMWLNNQYTLFKVQKTVDYTATTGQYVLKGDHLFPDMEAAWKNAAKSERRSISETEFFDQKHGPFDGTGATTALMLWPKDEIIKNAVNMTLLYLTTVVLFSLAVICCIQGLFCISVKTVSTKPGKVLRQQEPVS